MGGFSFNPQCLDIKEYVSFFLFFALFFYWIFLYLHYLLSDFCHITVIFAQDIFGLSYFYIWVRIFSSSFINLLKIFRIGRYFYEISSGYCAPSTRVPKAPQAQDPSSCTGVIVRIYFEETASVSSFCAEFKKSVDKTQKECYNHLNAMTETSKKRLRTTESCRLMRGAECSFPNTFVSGIPKGDE